MHIGHTFKVGHCTVKIVLDECGFDLDPTKDDVAIIMAVLHRRYANPAADRGLTSTDAIEDFETENCGENGEWEAFPLFMYDHSGTIYRVSQGGNPFHCPWDSGRVGTLFVKKAEVGDAWEAAEAFCKEYTDWANGNVWGFMVETPDGEVADSCWGFIGSDSEPYLIDEATAAATHINDKLLDKEAAEMEASRPDMYA